MKKITTTVFLLCMILSGVYSAQDIYVSPSGDDLNAGTQESPYATLAKATSMVSEDGAVIHVTAGTYVFSSTAIIKPYDQTIAGANAATTILDGNNAVALIDGITEFDNSQKILTISNVALKNAKYTGSTGVTTGGSAIRMGFKTNLNLDHCYFYKNASVNGGVNCSAGAIYFAGNNISVNSCFFEENSNTGTGSTAPGGAITVLLTTATNGATNALVKNSSFYKNSSVGRGAAIYFNRLYNTSDPDDNATFVVQNCVFLENAATATVGFGAAVMLSSGGANGTLLVKRTSIIMTNNTIIDNYSTNAGAPTNQNGVYFEGFMYESYMANNIVICEKTETGFSLLANQTTSPEYGMNNIIDLKSTQIDGADFNADAVVKNNVVTATTADAVGVSKTLSGYPISGDSFSVPYLTISAGSAVNAGTNSYLVNTIANPAPATPVEYVLQTDILGFSRVNSRDLGAYETSISTSMKNTTIQSYTIISDNQGIRILGLMKNDKLNVYNSNGCLLYNESVNQTEIQVPISTAGIYIISVNGKAGKYIHN